MNPTDNAFYFFAIIFAGLLLLLLLAAWTHTRTPLSPMRRIVDRRACHAGQIVTLECGHVRSINISPCGGWSADATTPEAANALTHLHCNLCKSRYVTEYSE